MRRDRISRPSSSVPSQCADEGELSRVGSSITAGSCGAIQGANSAKITNIRTSTTPIAASGLWRAFPAMRLLSETVVLGTDRILNAVTPIPKYKFVLLQQAQTVRGLGIRIAHTGLDTRRVRANYSER